MGRKYWTREEEQFIRDNIGNMTITGFSLYFNLEKVKIVDKIHKMGLNSSKARNVWWNDTEDRFCKKYSRPFSENLRIALLVLPAGKDRRSYDFILTWR